MKLWANRDVEMAEDLLRSLRKMDDQMFVMEVGYAEDRLPQLRILNCWMDGVRRELDMRLLLKR